MLTNFILLCAALFALGYGLCVLLYRSKGKRLRGSSLETKIVLWIPLFAAALVFGFSPLYMQIALAGFVLLQLGLEVSGRSTLVSARLFALLVALGVAAMVSLANHNPHLFLAVWFMSVLSDVVAFFAGNYLGRHPLPQRFNAHKSWEGVAGQLAGALLAFGLLALLVLPVAWQLAVVVGAGSAFGDLTNSYVKRRMGIKEWSNRLPGHGGYLDRFSSLSFAMLLALAV